jgi:hypothetical protein
MSNYQIPGSSSSGIDGWSALSANSKVPIMAEKQGRMGVITVTPVKVDEGKAGVLEQIKAQWERLVYFINNIGHSLAGINQSYVLRHKHDSVENFGETSGGVHIGSEAIEYAKSSGIGPHLLESKKGEKRFLQFELATMHDGFWQELHNISVLVDRESTPPRVYILDGKGQNPEEAFLTEMRPGSEVKSNRSVKDFIDLLTTDQETKTKADTDVAYINTPLQRRMDCVIFPLVIRKQLIEQTKTEEGSQTSAKDILETALNKCLEDPSSFYKEINVLRDQYFRK